MNGWGRGARTAASNVQIHDAPAKLVLLNLQPSCPYWCVGIVLLELPSFHLTRVAIRSIGDRSFWHGPSWLSWLYWLCDRAVFVAFLSLALALVIGWLLCALSFGFTSVCDVLWCLAPPPPTHTPIFVVASVRLSVLGGCGGFRRARLVVVEPHQQRGTGQAR